MQVKNFEYTEKQLKYTSIKAQWLELELDWVTEF